MRVRIDKELRQEFHDACRLRDKPAAQVLREFMRDYVAQARQETQRELFANERA